MVIIVKQYGPILHIVDVGTHLIHTVCRLYSHHVVALWSAEYPVNQVDGFVGAVAQEYVFRRYLLYFRQFCFQFCLQGLRVTVEGFVVRILIGIKKYMGLMPGEFVPSCKVPVAKYYL